MNFNFMSPPKMIEQEWRQPNARLAGIAVIHATRGRFQIQNGTMLVTFVDGLETQHAAALLDVGVNPPA
jgi:hypothetical protein